MATNSSILVWRIPWTEEPDRLYSPWGCKDLDTTEQPTLLHKARIVVLDLGDRNFLRQKRKWGEKLFIRPLWLH